MEQEYVFISNSQNRGLRLYDKPQIDTRTGKATYAALLAKFNPIAGRKHGEGFGVFRTPDKNLAEKLKKHRLCGISLLHVFGDTEMDKEELEKRRLDGYVGKGIFAESEDGKLPVIGRSTILVKGTRTSVSPQEQVNVKEAIEYGELKKIVLKSDGQYRADASEVEKQRYELLKEKFKE